MISKNSNAINCICCHPLINQFVKEITRRNFLLGVGSLAATVLSSKIANAQTESINIFEKEENKFDTLSLPITIYTAKKIITMESDNPIASAMAIQGDRLLAVGSLAQVKQALNNQPYEINNQWADKIILPGFIEQHLHPLLGVLSMALEIIAIEAWDLPHQFYPAAVDEKDYLAKLQETLKKMSSEDNQKTLFTWGYHHYFHGKIRRPQLDAISGDRPIVVWHRSCHEFILNTAALNKYGVKETDLQGKGLGSEQSNWEEGHFYEKGMEIIIPFIAKDILAKERLDLGINSFKSYLQNKGITTICEPGTQRNRQIQQYWESNLNGDDVTFRTYFIADGRSIYDEIGNKPAEILSTTKQYLSWGKNKVSWLPQQVKLFMDGAIFSQLMQLEEGYLDGHKGEWITTPENYILAFKIYWDAGYHIHTHVNGDAGLEVVINALAERMANNPRKDHRFTIVHFAVSTDRQVARLKELGAIVSANPYYVTSLADQYSQFGLGGDRADNMVRLGTCIKEDISISLHSDMPMAPADPLFLAWCAVNRQTVSGRIASPQQKISVEKALRGVTIEAAYSLELESEIGSLKTGKKADLTILEDDPLTINPENLKDIKIWGIMFEGNIYPISTKISEIKPTNSPVDDSIYQLEYISATRG